MIITLTTTSEEVKAYIEATLGKEACYVRVGRPLPMLDEAWISWWLAGEAGKNQGLFVNYNSRFDVLAYYAGTHPKVKILTTLDGEDIGE